MEHTHNEIFPLETVGVNLAAGTVPPLAPVFWVVTEITPLAEVMVTQ